MVVSLAGKHRCLFHLPTGGRRGIALRIGKVRARTLFPSPPAMDGWPSGLRRSAENGVRPREGLAGSNPAPAPRLKLVVGRQQGKADAIEGSDLPRERPPVR
jgi:hypothetical protein